MLIALKNLEDLIFHQMNLTTSRVDVDEDTLKHWLAVAQVETSKIKVCLRNDGPLFLANDGVRHFISCLHGRLIQLSDTLLLYIKQNSKYEGLVPKNLLSVQKAIFLVVDDLLHFVWKHYSKYCDLDQPVSEKTREIFVRHCNEVVLAIKKSECYQTYKVVKIALFPFNAIITDKRFKISFHTFCYLKEFLKEVQNFTQYTPDEKLVESFIKRLFYLNYNTFYFREYLIWVIYQKISELITYEEKIGQLYWFLKVVNQMPVKPNTVFIPKQGGIKIFMSEWLVEEIGYLENRMQLERTDKPEEAFNDFKIVTSLSVYQLGYLIHLFVKVGVIMNDKVSHVMRFFARHSRSKKQNNIASKSLLRKMYKPEDSTRERVKTIIIDVLNEINRK
jgi:hypothetical protein